jgi:hypothetical protein
VLLIEDLEDIDAPAGPLRDYDDVSASVVRSGGGVMYAGAELARLGGSCTRVTVPAAVAATIYLVNVRRWLAESSTHVPVGELEELETALSVIVRDPSPESVSWIVRQVVIGSDG